MYNEPGDIINIANEKFIILTKFNENDKNYAFINKVNDTEDEITGDYFITLIEGNEFVKLTDEKEINRLFPLVQENLKKEFSKNGIDLNSLNEEK